MDRGDRSAKRLKEGSGRLIGKASEERRNWMHGSLARYPLLAGLAVSGVVHAMLTPEHLHEAPILGLGFGSVAILQLVLACIFLSRPATSLWPASLVLTVFSLAMYIVSRVA